MQKVLIISYFFPPCNFIGAERISYWAENLHHSDVFPIIITRNWNDGQKDIIGKVYNNKYRIDINKKREVHYLKYKHQLRDFVVSIKYLRKILTLVNQLIFYVFPFSISYSNIFNKATDILKNERNIKHVIISGRPFESFFFGYKLKQKFPHINWVPDYRDQWNTYSDTESKSKLTKIFSFLESKLEKKWTSNCEFFISTTPTWVNNIGNFINKKGFFIANGFDKKIEHIDTKKNNDFIKIVYAGTLYPNQEIDDFCNLISNLNKTLDNVIKLEFIGCEMIKSQIKRLKKIKEYHKGEFIITHKMNKMKLAKKMNQADFLYLTSFNNISGWYPVKLFDYATYSTPILMYPSDGDLIEKFINDTNTGFAIKKIEDLKSLLISTLKKEIEGGNNLVKNLTKLNEFSREYQTVKLANLLINQ